MSSFMTKVVETKCPYCGENHNNTDTSCRFKTEGIIKFSSLHKTPIEGFYTDGGRDRGLPVEVEDCATRAISLALGEAYETIWSDLDKLIKNGSPDNGVSDSIIRKYLKSRGWIYTKTSNARMVHEDLPKEILIVKVRRHLVCVANHVFFDTFDSSNSGKAKVFGYYSKSKECELRDKK